MYIILLSAPRLPPMAAPKKGWSFTKAVERFLRSSYTPPWMMPYRLCHICVCICVCLYV